MTARTALIALLVGLLPAMSAAQSTSLNRLTDRDDLLGWEAVGRLDVRGVGFCTGTLIETDLVLTAAHCVHDPRNGSPLVASDITFRAGLRDGHVIASRTVERIAAHESYRPGGGMQLQNVRHDVALLRLSQPISTTDADPFVLYGGTPRTREVSVASYGKGRADALSRQRHCEIIGHEDALFAFDCDVTFGSSGAPVFARVGERVRILSIVSGGARLNGETVALGMALPSVVSDLKAQLLRDGPRRPTRTIRRLKVGTEQSGTGAKFVKP